MREFDLAIIGDGLTPCILALSLLAERPGVKLALVSSDAQIGGNRLELVLPDRLPAAFVDPLSAATTLEWGAFALRARGETDLVEERVWLVDPMQVWMDLRDRLPTSALFPRRDGLAVEGDVVSWFGGGIRAAALADARGLVRARRDEIVEARVFAELPYPVLADFDVGSANWGYLQYVPLGADRALINRIGRGDGDPIEDIAASPARIADLPTIACWPRLGELRAKLG